MDDEGERDTNGGMIARMAGAVASRVLELLDPDMLLEQIDVERLIERVDIDELLERVDVNRLLDRVGVNDLLDRVDTDRLLDRVDVNRLLDRVDVDRVMDRVDVDTVVKRAGIADIVAESTGQFADSAIDLFRRQLVGLDEVGFRFVQRLMNRDPASLPSGPAPLQDVAR
ncbi:MAG: hypothetical protein OEZ14_00130 [Acidimicrobiia bacterium]|nr:hypothetical protein [Acidimicrobiia bacterium]MDH5292171.1 hypothetical protein [Acidimicrobiia bacterium]MDH5518915.1 hypothetical protein [Acidimicrobiia bacterium]